MTFIVSSTNHKYHHKLTLFFFFSLLEPLYVASGMVYLMGVPRLFRNRGWSAWLSYTFSATKSQKTSNIRSTWNSWAFAVFCKWFSLFITIAVERRVLLILFRPLPKAALETFLPSSSSSSAFLVYLFLFPRLVTFLFFIHNTPSNVYYTFLIYVNLLAYTYFLPTCTLT